MKVLLTGSFVINMYEPSYNNFDADAGNSEQRINQIVENKRNYASG